MRNVHYVNTKVPYGVQGAGEDLPSDLAADEGQARPTRVERRLGLPHDVAAPPETELLERAPSVYRLYPCQDTLVCDPRTRKQQTLEVRALGTVQQRQSRIARRRPPKIQRTQAPWEILQDSPQYIRQSSV